MEVWLMNNRERIDSGSLFDPVGAPDRRAARVLFVQNVQGTISGNSKVDEV